MLEIKLKTKTYKVNKQKLTYVLEKLSQKNLKNCDDKEILNLFESYKLCDKIFLENINKI